MDFGIEIIVQQKKRFELDFLNLNQSASNHTIIELRPTNSKPKIGNKLRSKFHKLQVKSQCHEH